MEDIMYSHDRVMKVHDNMVDVINGLMEENAALKTVVAELTSHNSAMDAIAERYINEVSFLDSSDSGVVRSFVAYLQQQHQ
jgi:GTP1/Obg family GTP-binding protein